ncbi:MAG: hypothetical protein WD751_07495 [Anaerolineales bacterium]
MSDDHKEGPISSNEETIPQAPIKAFIPVPPPPLPESDVVNLIDPVLPQQSPPIGEGLSFNPIPAPPEPSQPEATPPAED